MGFRPVDPKVSFPELERGILEFWKQADIFRKSTAAREGAPLWIFYEGPPTANGKPGVHHVEPRTFKDIYPRFKTMTGHFVPRKAGWDCHGLPVELEVEKEIGTTGKRDIEAFGIAEFNQRCRESVTRYVDEFARLTDRIGFWIDMSDAYWTMSTEYIESVWWSLKQLHARGLLVESDKVTAYCPRCGTTLSDAEVAMGYATVEDPSIYVRFELVEVPLRPELVGASLIAWTTTPWTLPSNSGLAVSASASYAVLDQGSERVILAEALSTEVLQDPDLHVSQTVQGSDLVGALYRPLYPNIEGAHRVVAADFVSLEDGTGIVHMAPAFGPEDLEIGRREGWPVFKPVDDAGLFNDLAPEFVRGSFVKDADPKIIQELTSRGLILRATTTTHSYPFCWRCSTPLLYYARTSWYVRTTAVKDRLLQVNDSINWFPEHIRHGRYGDWLENNVDWALSRERYWGTPLPIWRCPAGHQTAIGSLKELGDLSGTDTSAVDPHRPAIDEITFACPTCGVKATRVPEVIDTWYDSGAMPFAQWGYHPELGRGLDLFAERFPADFISEAIDQTRGWFYTLMAEGVLHFDQSAYRNVVCLGHIIAADGRKMSKSLGNMFDPWEALDRQGADALRWYMLTSGSPWASRRIGHEVLDEVLRRFLLTLWNVYSFFVTYAEAEGYEPGQAQRPLVHERPLLDRWVLSRLAATVKRAREGLEAYDATGAGRAIEDFVEDLSNWYVRRSRRRFWNQGGSGGADSAWAFDTLHECLVTVATLLAPFTPFVSEEIWRNLAAGRAGRPESVHLADYPAPDPAAIDPVLDDAMAAARSIVELGRRARVENKVRTRQPLAGAVIHHPGDHGALADVLDLVRDELNVKQVSFAESIEELGRWRAKPNFKRLGPRLAGRVGEVGAALARDDGRLAGALARGDSVTVKTPSGDVALAPDDVQLIQEVTQGFGVASDAGITVALSLSITDQLRREGSARELVRLIQDARKAADLNVSDRIDLGVRATGELAAALVEHHEYIAGETLAVSITADLIAGGVNQESDIDGQPVVISVRIAAASS
jgi:isoleucyl-tRNA synthetase